MSDDDEKLTLFYSRISQLDMLLEQYSSVFLERKLLEDEIKRLALELQVSASGALVSVTYVEGGKRTVIDRAALKAAAEKDPALRKFFVEKERKPYAKITIRRP